MEDLFFWSSPEFGEKKCSIFDEDLFFWSLPEFEFGEKSVPFAFFFFGLHQLFTPEQNRGRGSSPQCRK